MRHSCRASRPQRAGGGVQTLFVRTLTGGCGVFRRRRGRQCVNAEKTTASWGRSPRPSPRYLPASAARCGCVGRWNKIRWRMPRRLLQAGAVHRGHHPGTCPRPQHAAAASADGIEQRPAGPPADREEAADTPGLPKWQFRGDESDDRYRPIRSSSVQPAHQLTARKPLTHPGYPNGSFEVMNRTTSRLSQRPVRQKMLLAHAASASSMLPPTTWAGRPRTGTTVPAQSATRAPKNAPRPRSFSVIDAAADDLGRQTAAAVSEVRHPMLARPAAMSASLRYRPRCRSAVEAHVMTRGSRVRGSPPDAGPTGGNVSIAAVSASMPICRRRQAAASPIR